MLNKTHLTLGKSENNIRLGQLAWSHAFGRTITVICLAEVRDELIQSYVYDCQAWTSEINMLFNDLAMTSNLSVFSVFT